MKKLLCWLIAGSSGGPNRAKIIMALHIRPYNAHQLAEELDLNYKTVRHHLKVLQENNVVTSSGKQKYGELYFLSDQMTDNYNIFNEIWDELSNNKENWVN